VSQSLLLNDHVRVVSTRSGEQVQSGRLKRTADIGVPTPRQMRGGLQPPERDCVLQVTCMLGSTTPQVLEEKDSFAIEVEEEQ
jgi:hypothetical protein